MQINWIGYQNRSGYAQASQDYIYALLRDGMDLRLSLLHSSPDQLAVTTERYREMVALTRKPIEKNAFHIFHCIPDMQRRVPLNGKNIGFATFETFDPPEHWAAILNLNDAVICPSGFNVKVFKEAGVEKPIFHIPHCLDTNLFNPNIQPLSPKDERFTFLFMGTWRKRKGWQQLLEAWMHEFDFKDNVRLVIKTDKYTMATRAVAEVRENLKLNTKEIAPIVFESRILNEVDLPRFMKGADCLICPTVGEGFGIPGLQSMALGIPVVITNFSGCTDYANNETATLIEPEKFIVINDMDKISQFKNRKWANITPDRVRQAMRYVIENTDAIQKKANYAAPIIAQNYNYSSTAKRFKEMLDTL
ncbi:MAG: glycosyltransferase family 4 protein [bacterium]